jgi:signal transduction histidine kinase
VLTCSSLTPAAEAITAEGKITIEAREHDVPVRLRKKTPDCIVTCNTLGRCAMREDTVDIMIRETQSGIDEEAPLRISDPFFTTKDVGKVSGLGLFVVHEIIEEHDGRIAVDSANKGTTFLIRLPFQEDRGGL